MLMLTLMYIDGQVFLLELRGDPLLGRATTLYGREF